MILILPMALDYLGGVYGGYDSAQVPPETAMRFTAVDPATGARRKDYPAWGWARHQGRVNGTG
ncbi:MAG TPA: hypothetical protein VLG68_01995 [Gammaproteobacteria bacterium]|nr:hypothetical protein [Gammaproteobacteria bacterium]